MPRPRRSESRDRRQERHIAPLPAFVITLANGLLFCVFWVPPVVVERDGGGVALLLLFPGSRARGGREARGGASALRVSDDFFSRYGIRAILVARLLPFDVISYGAGLTPMTYLRFFVATGIGQLPATVSRPLTRLAMSQHFRSGLADLSTDGDKATH